MEDIHIAQRAASVERPASAWANLADVCEFNYNLADRTLWAVKLDWGRTKSKLGVSLRLDVLLGVALCWEWWAVVGYRFGHWVHMRTFPELEHARFFKWVLQLQQATLLRFSYLLNRLLEGLSGARLNPLAEIGPGFLLMHSGSCGIGAGVRIGDWFTMHQDSNVMGRGDGTPAPVLGKNIVLYSGARVLGAVTVGDNVRIGANALVLHDLPPDCVAVGVPARPVVRGQSATQPSASAQLQAMLATLLESGALKEMGEGVYIDVAGGEEIKIVIG